MFTKISPLILFVLPLGATPLLSVSASVMDPAGSFDTFTDSHSVTQTYTLTVSGGTGSGYFTPDLHLRGATNQSGTQYEFLGGIASASWPNSMSFGDPASYATTSPEFWCGPMLEECSVPFTFDVPQNFTITLSASAIAQANPQDLPTAFNVTDSVEAEFNGILGFRTQMTSLRFDLPDAQYTLVDPPVISVVPEPSAVLLLMTGLLWIGVLLLVWRP